MNQTIKHHAQQLRLSGLLNSLELRLQEAESNRLPYSQFLELVLQDELHVRHQRQIVRRNKSADFREQRNLEDFDFSFNPSVPRGRIYELAACHFIRQHRDVLLVGPPKPPTYCPSGRCCSYKGHYALTVFVLRELFSHGAMAEASLDLRAM
jgi:DNA replication protein DnaC